MTKPAGRNVGLILPPEWILVDPEVLSDPNLLAVLGFPARPMGQLPVPDDVICLAVLSELLQDDDDRPIGAVLASVVAVLAPLSPPGQVFPISRRESFGDPVDGIQPLMQVVIHRASFPEINCDLLIQFSTPNLLLLEDLEPLFERIADSATCQPAQA